MPKILWLFWIILFITCKEKEAPRPIPEYASLVRAKFEPANGKCLVLVEEMGEENNAYVLHSDPPAGISISSELLDDYSEVKKRIGDEKVLSLGIHFGSKEELVFKKHLQYEINQLGAFLKTMPEKVIFLRLGYEFDDFAKYKYSRQPFLLAYKHIHIELRKFDMVNIVYVWQSSGLGTYRDLLDEWYPGDKWVDWLGFSFYDPRNVNHPMIQFARDHKKPILIGGAAPLYIDAQSKVRPIDLSSLSSEVDIWKEWYQPFFQTVESYSDVIKGFTYTHGNWEVRPVWGDHFGSLNSTISSSPIIQKKWDKKLSDKRYLLDEKNLMDHLVTLEE